MALFNFPYAQYGNAQIYVQDIARYVKYALEDASHQIYFSPGVKNDAVNILVGIFDDVMADLVVSYARQGIKFVVIALKDSESAPEDDANTSIGREFTDHGNRNFKKVAKACKNIWCLSQVQRDFLAQIVPATWLHILPFGYIDAFVKADIFPNRPKDIDFLFIGTPTPHGKRVFWELQGKKFNVLSCDKLSADLFLANIVDRSRVCLGLPQLESWKYPTVMRDYYHLMNRSFLLAETNGQSSAIDNYIATAAPGDFIQACIDACGNPGLPKITARNFERFRDEVPLKPLFVDFLARSLDIASKG